MGCDAHNYNTISISDILLTYNGFVNTKVSSTHLNPVINSIHNYHSVSFMIIIRNSCVCSKPLNIKFTIDLSEITLVLEFSTMENNDHRLKLLAMPNCYHSIVAN